MVKLTNKNEYIVSVFTKLNLVIMGLISSILINRYLGPDLKGMYAYILNYVNIISLVLNLGIGQSFTYFKRKDTKNVKNEYINIFYFQLYVYLLIIVVINLFYNDMIFNIILLLSCVTQFNSQITFFGLIENVNRRNIISLVVNFSYLVMLLVAFTMLSKGLYIIIYISFIKLLLETILTIKSFKVFPTSIKINCKLLLNILRFSLFPMITSLLITFNYNIDVIILKQFVSYDNIGIYSVGVTLAGMLWIIPDAFKDVLFNKTAKNDSIRDIVFGIKFNVYICIVIIMGFYVFGEKFILIIYGNEYINAYGISLILFIGCIPMIFFKLINTLYISIGRQRFAFGVLSLAVLLNVVMNYIVIPYCGICGAAFSSVLSYSLCGIIFLLSFIKKYDLKINEILFFNKLELKKIKNLIVERN